MATTSIKNEKLVNIIALAIPLAVAMLLNPRMPKVQLGEWTKVLPHLNGIINSLTAVLLIAGLYFIKNKNIEAHRKTMLAAFGLGAMFLICYIFYHLSNQETKFGGEGIIRPIYYFLLATHIILSIGVVWFVLKALNYAIQGDFARHKAVVKWAYPIWLYVSITGVIVYLMISPYYV
jgi:putative membrane protein